MPIAVSIFNRYMLMIAAFDLWETEDWMDANLNLTKTEPISDQFDLLDYESVHFIRNLGFMYFIFLGTVCYTLFVLLVKKVCTCKNKTCRTSVDYLYNSAIWNLSIRFFLESHMIICVCFMTSMTSVQIETAGELFSAANGVLFSLVILALPCLLTYLVWMYESELRSEWFTKKYGSLLLGIDVKGKGVLRILFYPLMFGARRIIMAISCVFLLYDGRLQLMISYLVSFFVTVSVMSNNFFATRKANRIEAFNEYTVLILLYHQICFVLGFIPNADTRELIGYSSLLWIILNLCVNLFILL